MVETSVRELTEIVENLLEFWKVVRGAPLIVETSVRELTDMVEYLLVVAP